MTNRKAHNSILFLTTLSVYFGLVLVGGSPVFAHAALTQRFELVNELEAEDDLDKKPDDEQVPCDVAAVCEELARLAGQLAERRPEILADAGRAIEFSAVSLFGAASEDRTPSFWNRLTARLPDDAGRNRPGAELLQPETQFRFGIARGNGSPVPTDDCPAFFGAVESRPVATSRTVNPIRGIPTVSPDLRRIVIVTALPRASLDDINS